MHSTYTNTSHDQNDLEDMDRGQNQDFRAEEYREGPVARSIEEQTAKIPSDMFLWAGIGSIALSLALNLSGKKEQANFVGHWAPTFLILGVYNKMVKLHGSDHQHPSH